MRCRYPATCGPTLHEHRRLDRRDAAVAGTVRPVRFAAVFAIVVATAAIAACGDASDGDASTGPESAPTVLTTADQAETMSGEVICERLSVASVTSDTGLDITRSSPATTPTPNCSYEYTTDAGGLSTLTVSSMRADDVDALTGTDAFGLVVNDSESVAGAPVDTQEVSAGDAAVRISGASMHVGVVQLGERVLMVVIPVDDVETDAVDRLIATMATTLG